MIELKTPAEIARMARAGQVLAECFQIVGAAIHPGITTAELDHLADDFLRAQGVEPTFFNYHGFPAACCISPNAVIAHGIPDDTVLKNGDIVSLDIGATLDGWVADSARTYPVGTIDAVSQALIDAGERALVAGIAAARVGAHTGAIGAAIEAVAKQAGFAVFTDYTGHGLGRVLHEDPIVPNVGPANHGMRLQVGMTIAIEPMFVAGDPTITVSADQWTAVIRDGSRATHTEHTVAITAAGPEILTAGR